MKLIINITLLLLLPILLKTNLYPQIQLMPPTLLYPANEQGFEFAPTEFRWTRIKDAQYYGLQITTDVTFLNIKASDINRGFVIDTIFRPTPTSLIIDTVYYWRVSAKTWDSTGEWSFIRYFITGDKSNVYEKLNSQTNLSIIPMPINNQAKIIVNSKNNAHNFNLIKIYLFDINGQLIAKIGEYNYDFNEITEINFDASRYNSGAYTLFLMNENSKIIAVKNIIINN